ncbi:MAG: helix-hairpin-helix domain-containing protein [Firmicutes bacterium]|nr:helix-hairpin-helix domain-containing protein [Candidatus Fermentithermobacillaceae bacterium]
MTYRRVDLAIYVLIGFFLLGTGTVWWRTIMPEPVKIITRSHQETVAGDSHYGGGGRTGIAGEGINPSPDRGGAGYGNGSEPPAEIVVHVAGAVKNPGVYKLRDGQRVYEAVEMAGGARQDAALDSVNLAQVLSDGEKVYIPAKGELSPGGGLSGATTSNGTGGTARLQNPFPVNVNTADSSLLDLVPGIGPSIAQAIITYRRENGPFRSIEDLLNVPGIGPKTLSKIAPFVTVR